MTKKWLIPLTITAILLIGIIFWFSNKNARTTIKVGILHSLSGDLAISEKPVADATLLAIKEINANGGILGRKIEPILVDGKSDARTFAAQAEELITQKKVAAIFGCWTSPSRIAVKNIVEKYNSLLFYPVQFEGLETSNNVVYTSTTPNQQIIPGITWCMQHLGKKFFLVGSDPILHEIIKDVVYAYDGEIVGIEYLAFDDKNVEPIIQKIIDTQPSVILNNIEGESNLLFFNELRKHNITPEKIPTMSFSISEPELELFKIDTMVGDYASWSYFESIDSRENKLFIKKIEKMYGEKQALSDAMEAAYFGVYLFKQAAEKAQSFAIDALAPALHTQAFNAPQGIIHIAQEVLQTWGFARIGKIRSDRQFTILWSSEKSIRPMAYPPSRSAAEWDELATTIRKQESMQ
jgi:urea transport system substrate-binding protein